MLRPHLVFALRASWRSKRIGTSIALVIVLVSTIWLHVTPSAHASTTGRVPSAHVYDVSAGSRSGVLVGLRLDGSSDRRTVALQVGAERRDRDSPIGKGPRFATEAETGASSAVGGQNLGRQLASEQQIGEIGTPLSGAGTSTPLRDAERLAEQYGGNASDWSKMGSTSYTGSDGRIFETHWYENDITGVRTEFKTKFPDSSLLGFK